jgi:hypothetical protein
MFGNTRLIAEAVAGGLSAHMDVMLIEVGQAPVPDQELDLIVVGGPTHAFGMSRENTRRSAADMTESPLVSEGIGIREWLDRLDPPSGARSAAAFDTKLDKPWLPGSASAKAQRKLRKLGFALPVEPESFIVEGGMGPVLAGESERAHRWGDALGLRVADEIGPGSELSTRRRIT